MKRFTKTEINKAEKVIRENFKIWDDVTVTRRDTEDFTEFHINDGTFVTHFVIEKVSKIYNTYLTLGFDMDYVIMAIDDAPVIEITLWKKK